MTYGEVLRMFLAESDMTPAELARRIGKSRSYVSQLMSGKVKEPSVSLAYAISDAMGIPTQSFIDMMRKGNK